MLYLDYWTRDNAEVRHWPFLLSAAQIASSPREPQRNGKTHLSRGPQKVRNLWRALGYRTPFHTDGKVYLPHPLYRLAG